MTRRARGAAACAAAFALLLAPIADGHVLAQRPGLRQLLQSSELAVVVEFVSPLRMWEAKDGSDRQEYFSVRVLETLVGDPKSTRFDAFPHSEGMPDYHEGDRAIVFLQRVASRPEFARLSDRFTWFLIQEPGQEWKLEGAGGEGIRRTAREYRDLLSLPNEDALAKLRALLVRSLRSEQESLRDDALAELVRGATLPTFLATPEDVRPFAALVGRVSGLPLSHRIALSQILDGRGGVDGRALLRGFTAEPLTPEERLHLVRIVGSVPDAPLSHWLATQLGSPDPLLRREAAYALAHPWHAIQAKAVQAALQDPDAGVARAALRSLGAIGTPEARAALAQVAAGDDAFLRQLAQAELRREAGARNP